MIEPEINDNLGCIAPLFLAVFIGAPVAVGFVVLAVVLS